jgi:hypothetical protein
VYLRAHVNAVQKSITKQSAALFSLVCWLDVKQQPEFSATRVGGVGEGTAEMEMSTAVGRDGTGDVEAGLDQSDIVSKMARYGSKAVSTLSVDELFEQVRFCHELYSQQHL